MHQEYYTFLASVYTKLNKMNQNNKFLIIVVGIPRGGQTTFNSIYKHLVKPLKADLAICSEEKYIINNSLSRHAKYLWFIDDNLNWNEYYQKFKNGNYNKYFEAGKETGLENSGKIHFAIKDIILNNYIDTLEEYDFIVYTRFDQFHFSNHEVNFSKDNIYIQEGEDYGGLNDRHAVFASEYSKKFLDICNYIDSNQAIINMPEHPNCESVFKQFLIDSELTNIERFKRYQFTVLKIGDITRWRIPTYKIHLKKNLFFKYPDEFLNSFMNYLNKRGLIITMVSAPILTINYLILLTRKKISKYLPKHIKNYHRKSVAKKKHFEIT